MKSATQVQILYKAVGISLLANDIGKGMNLSVIPAAKIIGRAD